MKFDVITIFPEIFDSFLKESLLAKAKDKKIIRIKIHNLRDWAKDKRKIVALRRIRQAHRGESIEPQAQGNREPRRTIDDKPYGGGPGMVLKIEPIYEAIREVRNKNLEERKKSKIVFLSPRGKKFNQKIAQKWAKELKQLIIISGRYEGIDERVKKIADETISVGDFITLGGEVPAMAIIEAVSRLVPGVVGKKESIQKLDFPQYTRPETVKSKVKTNKLEVLRVPKILLSGNHKKIEEWRKKYSKEIK